MDGKKSVLPCGFQGTLDLLMTHGASRSLIRFGRTSIYLRF